MSIWTSKDPGESVIAEFDFSNVTTFIDSATVTVEVESGTDTNPGSILGAKTIVGAHVQQRFLTGTPGCRYRVKCAAVCGSDTYVDYATLPVFYGSTNSGSVAVSDYTSYGEIRAALGISSEEADDETLGLPMYGDHLGGEFSDLEDDLKLIVEVATTFATIQSISPGSRTALQKRALSTISLFSTYAVARHLGTSLPMMAPKEIGDGKALMSRFTNDPYKVTLQNVELQYGRARDRLNATLSLLSSTDKVAIVTSFLGIASPGTDPVTG